jgi:tetratricopeptide (TPR) repeat protein
MTYYYQGDYESAAAEFQRAIEVDPEYALAYGHLGWVYYFYQRDFEEAVKNFEKALELGGLTIGREAEFHIELGWSYYFLEGCEKALPHFEKALDLLEIEPDENLLNQAWEGYGKCTE